MGTEPAAETEGKGQRVLQPEAGRDGSSGAWGRLLSPCLPRGGGAQEASVMAQGGGERVGSKDQDVQSKIFLGTDVLAKGAEMGQGPGERGRPPFA